MQPSAPSSPEGASGGCRSWSASSPASSRPGSATRAATSRTPPTATTAPTPRASRSSSIRRRSSYRDLLEFFFQIHDPTTKNRQGNDVGMSYRSAIYYTSDEQRRRRRGHDRRRRRVGPVAGHGRHRGGAGRPLLGGRAGAPGLPPALPERLHVPLRPAELEAAPPPGRVLALPLIDRSSARRPAAGIRAHASVDRAGDLMDGATVCRRRRRSPESPAAASPSAAGNRQPCGCLGSSCSWEWRRLHHRGRPRRLADPAGAAAVRRRAGSARRDIRGFAAFVGRREYRRRSTTVRGSPTGLGTLGDTRVDQCSPRVSADRRHEHDVISVPRLERRRADAVGT